MTMFQISIAIAMVAVALALVIGYRGYLAQQSSKRLERMLKRLGLEPGMTAAKDNEAIMQEVRRRCRRCSTEAFCERWLAGEEKGPNTFCPNAKVFELLKQQAATAA